MRIEGSITWLRSRTTGKEFPTFVFRADTDMATEGLIALTSTGRPEVVLTMMTGDEWSADDDSRTAERVNRELGRSDLRAVPLLTRHPAPLRYRDIFVEGGEADIVREEPRAAFRRNGGSIIVRLRGHPRSTG